MQASSSSASLANGALVGVPSTAAPQALLAAAAAPCARGVVPGDLCRSSTCGALQQQHSMVCGQVWRGQRTPASAASCVQRPGAPCREWRGCAVPCSAWCARALACACVLQCVSVPPTACVFSCPPSTVTMHPCAVLSSLVLVGNPPPPLPGPQQLHPAGRQHPEQQPLAPPQR
jgi:hypothetical protein